MTMTMPNVSDLNARYIPDKGNAKCSSKLATYLERQSELGSFVAIADCLDDN